MKHGLGGLAALLLLTACAAGAVQTGSEGRNVKIDTPDLPDLGAAPELTNTVWLNTDRSLRLADLRGKVVLIDMWTFD